MNLKEKKVEEFLEREQDTLQWGCKVFFVYFKSDYIPIFIDYPQIFDSIKNLKKSLNSKVIESKILVTDKPFGFDQFLFIAPLILFPSALKEILLGINPVINSCIEAYYNQKRDAEVFSFTELEKIAASINASF